ncbi:hypothetical protein CPB86DRAFT_859716 [Serendipita vermifera]|nr:hypothetical protein CPB86DRAFT_859716 [Serendipita vermifera]
MPKPAPSKLSTPTSAPHDNLNWPEISMKQGLTINVVEADQILVLDGFLTKSECTELIRFIDSLPLEITPPPKRGEATRVNHRVSIQSPTFATTLFALLSPHLPSLPSFQKHIDPPPTPRLCNENIRLYKYTEGQYFGPHYDDSVPGPPIPITPVADTATNEQGPNLEGEQGTSTKRKSDGKKGKAKQLLPPVVKTTPSWSEWTILIYLTGQEDGVVGGETAFYVEEGTGKSRRQREVVPSLTRGSLLLHRHGKECLLHEGRLVARGTKYVLRSDLMFARPI